MIRKGDQKNEFDKEEVKVEAYASVGLFSEIEYPISIREEKERMPK
jgi:hypothetical protein